MYDEPTPWTVGELIEAAERIMASAPELFGEASAGTSRELNIRLIRDYVVREILPRPTRTGREARFGRSHLVRLLAGRALLRHQKWSLSAIKASFSSADPEDLLNSVLVRVRPLVDAECRQDASDTSRSGDLEPPAMNAAQLLIEQFRSASPPSSGGRSRVHIPLEPWCEVVVDARQASSATPDEIERLGETLKRRLHAQAARKKGEQHDV